MAAPKTPRKLQKPAAPIRQRPKTKKPKKGGLRMLSHAQVAAAVATLAAPTGTARFAAGKALAATAERDPARVYPYFDAIAGLLGSASKIVRWNTLQILGALAAVDDGRKLDGWLVPYLKVIQGGNLISAANALQGAGRIAAARPDLHDQIIPTILGVEHATYESAECCNVAIGQALNALEAIGPVVGTRRDVMGFVQRQCANSRAAVARHAAKMVEQARGQ